MTGEIFSKPILSTREIAEILQIKENTIHSRRWKETSGCPLLKKGKRLSAIGSEFWKWYKARG